MADSDVRSVLTPITKEITIYPSGTGGTSNCSITNPTNAYKTASSTDYATIQGSGASRTCYSTFTFDCSTIPSDAIINSVSCNARASWTSSYITNVSYQLYANNTAKGSTTTATSATSGSGDTLTNIGTWTRTELGNISLRVNFSTTSSASSSNRRRFYFYGSDLTINYTYNSIAYEITTTITNGTLTSPAYETVGIGEDATISFNGDTKTVFDHMSINGTNVTPTETSGSYSYTIKTISEDKNVDIVFNKIEEKRTYLKVGAFEWVLANRVYKKAENGWEKITDQDLLDYARDNKIRHIND